MDQNRTDALRRSREIQSFWSAIVTSPFFRYPTQVRSRVVSFHAPGSAETACCVQWVAMVVLSWEKAARTAPVPASENPYRNRDLLALDFSHPTPGLDEWSA